MSKRSLTAIWNELSMISDTETGGVFLGHHGAKEWYVIESINPGWQSMSEKNRFEYDREYVEYTANRIANLYKIPLELMGMWHSHLSDKDIFSEQDIETNYQFVKEVGNDIISAIMNPRDMRMTFYHITEDQRIQRIPWSIFQKDIPIEYLEYQESDFYKNTL